MKDIQRTTIVAGLAAVAVVGFSACASSKSAPEEQTSASPATSMAAPGAASAMADPAADLIGSGCADYAAQHPSGPASVTGMAQVDTLNSGQYTVFAPTNAAFDKLPAATIDELKTNSNMLKSILTYHVVQGQLSPAKVDGAHKTLQGADAMVTGKGNDLKVNDAGLVCGGVHTANATVYMIDTVLKPPGQ
jgi:hypothetical protein